MRNATPVFVLTVVISLTAAGCETMGEDTKKGAGIGALTGAAIGGIVGHQDGHGWEGALIGGAAGATAGGLIGNQMDKKGQGAKLTIYDVAKMAKDGVPENLIVEEVQRSKSKFTLSSQHINYLKDNGVSDYVIDVMLATSR